MSERDTAGRAGGAPRRRHLAGPGSVAWTTVPVTVVLACLGATLEQPSASAHQTDSPQSFHPGSADLHDRLVPGYGNGGYDVRHYDIRLHYTMASGVLSGTTTIRAQLTENLSRFNLDFALPVKSVTVNGSAAEFELETGVNGSQGKEIVVTPDSGLPRGSTMTVKVTYHAKPFEVRVHGYSEWSTTITGVTVWNEPDAASEWWYPGNAYPSDKATYDVTVTTNKRYQAITNGALLSRTVHGTQATAHWRSTAPMASYLAFLTIGEYDVVRSALRAGTPTFSAYERTGSSYVERARRDVSRLPEILDALGRWWGPYPFDVAGGIVSQTPYGTAFESQTRPTFTALYWRYHPRNVWAVVHEAAHQWFGDSVTMSRWRYIWLAEGFATYTEWAWSQAHGNGTTEELFEANYQLYPKDDPFWRQAVTHPSGPLDNQAYERGAMTLQALRNKVGGADFFAIMRAWSRLHRDGNGSSGAFATLASRLSGQDLSGFFRVWLDSKHRPAPIRRNGFPEDFASAAAGPAGAVPASFAAIRRTDASLAALPTPDGSRGLWVAADGS